MENEDPLNFYMFFSIADKTKLSLFYEYSDKHQYKKELKHATEKHEEEIKEMDDIYWRMKAFSLKKKEFNYSYLLLLYLNRLFSDEVKLHVSFFKNSFQTFTNFFLFLIRKQIISKDDKISKFRRMMNCIIDNLIKPLSMICFESNPKEIISFDNFFNILASNPNEKMENTNIEFDLSPKTFFCFRMFMNIMFKLPCSSHFAALMIHEKTWIKVLEVTRNTVIFLSKHTDIQKEYINYVLNDIQKFIASILELDINDNSLRIEIYNAISSLILTNPVILVSNFSAKDDALSNYIYLTSYLVRNGNKKKIDVYYATTALVKCLELILNQHTNEEVEREKIPGLISLIKFLGPDFLNNFLNEKTFKKLLPSVDLFRDIKLSGAESLSQEFTKQEKLVIMKIMVEGFYRELTPQDIKNLIKYCKHATNESQRPLIYNFLEKVTIRFPTSDVDEAKDAVKEILHDLNLEDKTIDLNYLKFCCFFILKIEANCIPEGFILKELYENILKVLSQKDSNIAYNLIKNLPDCFYSICFKGSILQSSNIKELYEGIAQLVDLNIDNIADIFYGFKTATSDHTKLSKDIAEFLEMHNLISNFLQFPLKLKQGYFDSDEETYDPVVMIPRLFCSNCGCRNRKIYSPEHQIYTKGGNDYCKNCSYYLEHYFFKKFPDKMLEKESLEVLCEKLLQNIRGKLDSIDTGMEEELDRIEKKSHDIWNFIDHYENVIWHSVNTLYEMYNQY